MHYSSITETAKLLLSRELTPTELVAGQYNRINRHDTDLNSFASLTEKSAFTAAKKAEDEIRAGNWRGPLHGIPIAVKDLYGVSGAPTTFGSRHLSDHNLTGDAEVVRRLRSAGAIIMGTLRMSEAALTDHGVDLPTPLNPWDPATWVGTSSSGSAAATAAGLCFSALASDTGGSIRGPATATGLTGLKPTRGTIPTDGTVPLSKTLDTLGPFTRSARDCRIVFNAMANESPPTGQFLRAPDAEHAHSSVHAANGARIGLDRGLLETVHRDIREMVELTASQFESMGATIAEVTVPNGNELASEWVAFVGYEASRDISNLYPADSSDHYGREVAFVLEQGRKTTQAHKARIVEASRVFAAETDQILNRVDAILLPTIAVPSPTINQVATMRESYDVWNDQVMRLSCPYNYSGHPALTFPTGYTPRNTPLGAQLVGKHGREGSLLDLVEAFQASTSFHERHPSMYP